MGRRKENLMEELAANGTQNLTEQEIRDMSWEQMAAAAGEKGVAVVCRVAVLEEQLEATEDPTERRRLGEMIYEEMCKASDHRHQP